MLMMLFDTGLRVSELTGVATGDLVTTHGLIRVRGGKGDKDRTVPPENTAWPRRPGR